MKGSWVTIDGKNGNGGGGQSSSNKWGGTTSSYPTSGTQGGGYSTSRTSGENQTQNSVVTSNYWGSGNSQGLGKIYDYSEVFGTSGHTKKNPYGDSETIDYIIEFCRRKSADCWGSNALHHGSGGKDAPLYVKAINLGKTDMHDKDAGNLFYVLRDFNFSMDIINLSNNKLGNLGVESIIYGITCLQYQTLYSAESGWKPYQGSLKTVQSVVNINLSNNQIGDGGAKLLADAIA